MQQFKKNRVCVCGVGGGAVSELPSGPVIRSQCFHSCGPGSIPGWGTTIPQASWCGKKKKKRKKQEQGGRDLHILQQCILDIDNIYSCLLLFS